MIGILLCGHGHFASGLQSALTLIMGEQDDLCAVDFPKGETNTELKEHITAALERFKALEHVLVMCDLLSGSPFNTAIMEAMKDARIHVVYGVNLGMLMETTLMRNMGEDIDKLIQGWDDCIKELSEVGTYNR